MQSGQFESEFRLSLFRVKGVILSNDAGIRMFFSWKSFSFLRNSLDFFYNCVSALLFSNWENFSKKIPRNDSPALFYFNRTFLVSCNKYLVVARLAEQLLLTIVISTLIPKMGNSHCRKDSWKSRGESRSQVKSGLSQFYLIPRLSLGLL